MLMLLSGLSFRHIYAQVCFSIVSESVEINTEDLFLAVAPSLICVLLVICGVLRCYSLLMSTERPVTVSDVYVTTICMHLVHLIYSAHRPYSAFSGLGDCYGTFMHSDRANTVSSRLPLKRPSVLTRYTVTRHAFSAGQYKEVAGLLPDIFELCWRFPGYINLGIRADVLHLGALLHAKLLRQAQACTPPEALTLAKESLSIRQYLYGLKDQSVAASYGNIAILQIACGKYKEALGSLDQCMAIRQVEAKKGASFISYTYLYYGWCYTMMDQHLAANEALAKSLAMITKKYGEEFASKKPLYVWIHTAQAYVYRKIGIRNRAKDSDRRAYGTSITIYGLQSSRTLLPWYKSAWWHWENGSL